MNHLELLNLLRQQDRSIFQTYAMLAKDLGAVLRRYKITDSSKLWFKNTAVRKEVEALMKAHQKRVLSTITNNARRGWDLSNKHNDNLVDSYTASLAIPEARKQAFYQRNIAAFSAFSKRAQDGITLSDRVWRLNRGTMSKINYFLAEGLTKGRSAANLTKDLKRYLKEPNKRFRRIRDPKTGKLKLSNPAKNYKPGRGVYRSSYANALRLSRNETGVAYRLADHTRREQLPFVRGIKVNLSPSHPTYDICDELQGDYPKNFVFTGWHTNCLCFTTTKLLSKKDFKKYLDTGKVAPSKLTGKIPKRAGSYLNKNAKTIKGLSNNPYFIRDNFKNTKDGLALKKAVGDFRTTPVLNIKKALENEGINLSFRSDKSFQAYLNNASKFNLVRMFSNLGDSLKKNGIRVSNREVIFRDNDFHFRLSGPNDFSMTRAVDYASNSVYHKYLKIPSNLQGKGATKELFRSLLSEYEAAGLSKIKVDANIDIGGYAWAKYGFYATNKSDVVRIIKRSFDKDFQPKAFYKIRYHYSKYGDDAPFPMIRLANIEGGKMKLLNTNWEGELDLKNKRALKRLKDYLGR